MKKSFIKYSLLLNVWLSDIVIFKINPLSVLPVYAVLKDRDISGKINLICLYRKKRYGLEFGLLYLFRHTHHHSAEVGNKPYGPDDEAVAVKLPA